MRETRGYLEFVVDVAEKQPSQPSEPKVIVRLAEKALGITKRWNKLHRKVKYWGSFLSIFSKPLACQTFDMVSGIIWFCFWSHFNSKYVLFPGISEDDFRYRVIASPDKLIHPYLIELEICLWDMWHHFGSRTVFWERIDSDPATLTLTYWRRWRKNAVRWFDFLFCRDRSYIFPFASFDTSYCHNIIKLHTFRTFSLSATSYCYSIVRLLVGNITGWFEMNWLVIIPRPDDLILSACCSDIVAFRDA